MEEDWEATEKFVKKYSVIEFKEMAQAQFPRAVAEVFYNKQWFDMTPEEKNSLNYKDIYFKLSVMANLAGGWK